MRLRNFAAIALVTAAGAAAAFVALSGPARTPAQNGQMAEVVVRASVPRFYIEEVVVRPHQLADAGSPASTLN
jgi:hypothetical protein